MRRSRQAHDEGEVPEYWTAYADLLLTVLVIFVIVAAVQLREAGPGREAQARMRRIDEVQRRTRAAVKRAVEQAASDGSMVYDSATGTVRINSEVLFDSASATLRNPAALVTFGQTVLPSLLMQDTIRKEMTAIEVEGHTSPEGDYLVNLRLSQERAFAAAERIRSSLGPQYRLVVDSLLSVKGMSESRPLLQQVNGRSEVDYARSRRLEVHIRFRTDELLRALLDSTVKARLR